MCDIFKLVFDVKRKEELRIEVWVSQAATENKLGDRYEYAQRAGSIQAQHDQRWVDLVWLLLCENINWR